MFHGLAQERITALGGNLCAPPSVSLMFTQVQHVVRTVRRQSQYAWQSISWWKTRDRLQLLRHCVRSWSWPSNEKRPTDARASRKTYVVRAKEREENKLLPSTLKCALSEAVRCHQPGGGGITCSSVPNSRSPFCATPTHLIPPGLQHKVVTMASSSAAEQDPAPSIDDQDESVRIAIKALGDMRNSRPQPSSSNSIRVYNLSHPPS